MVLTYDACYKLLFSAPKLVRDLIAGFIPADWLHSLDYDTLEKVPGHYVTDDLRQRANDVVWRIRAGGEWVYLYLQIEFQSTVDPHMAVRAMDYLALLYQDLIRRNEGLPQCRLPPVLPVVLYTGKAPWNAATDIGAMVPKAPGLTGKCHPQLAYLLVDTSQYQDSDLRALNNHVAMAVRFERVDLDALPALIDGLHEMLGDDAELQRTFSIWARQLLYRRSDRRLLLPEVMNLKELNMSLVESLDRLVQEGELKGKLKGKLEGKQEGEARVLQKVLSQRFGPLPPHVEWRIMTAGPERIESWVDRLGAATCLDDIFQGQDAE